MNLNKEIVELSASDVKELKLYFQRLDNPSEFKKIKDKIMATYTVELYRADDNSILEKHSNVPESGLSMYNKIEKIKFYTEYVPFIKYHPTYKFIQKD